MRLRLSESSRRADCGEGKSTPVVTDKGAVRGKLTNGSADHQYALWQRI